MTCRVSYALDRPTVESVRVQLGVRSAFRVDEVADLCKERGSLSCTQPESPRTRARGVQDGRSVLHPACAGGRLQPQHRGGVASPSGLQPCPVCLIPRCARAAPCPCTCPHVAAQPLSTSPSGEPLRCEVCRALELQAGPSSARASPPSGHPPALGSRWFSCPVPTWLLCGGLWEGEPLLLGPRRAIRPVLCLEPYCDKAPGARLLGSSEN